MVRKLSWLAVAALWAAFFVPHAWAQSSVLQSGPPTAGQIPVYQLGSFGQAIIGASGPASGGNTGQGVNEWLQINRGSTSIVTPPFSASGSGPLGTHDCRYSGPITASGFFLCFDADIGGSPTIAAGAYGGAAWSGLNLNLNGTVYPFPGPGNGDVLGPASAGDNHIVAFNGTTGKVLKDSGLAVGTIAPHVPTNAALAAAATTTYPSGVWRDDYAAGLGATPIFYLPSGSTCATPDNGAQVASANGGCWLAQFPASGADIREWGVAFDDSIDNSVALQAAFDWWALGNKLILPAATSSANFGTAIAVTFASNGLSATVEGAGPDVSFLKYTGASGTALTIALGGAASSTHWRDFTLLTDHTGGASGIALSQSGTNSNPANSAFNDFTNVALRGADGYAKTDYWTTGISLTSVSNVNFNGLNIVGAGASGTIPSNAVGVSLLGTSSANGVAFNFNGCTINYVGTAILYGGYVQGVVVSGGSNLIGVNDAVKLTTLAGTDQLVIADSSLNVYHAGVYDQVGVNNVVLHHNFIATNGNGTYGALFSVYGSGDVFDGNVVFPQVANAGVGVSVGVGAGGTTGAIFIDKNTITGQATGINLGASSTNITVGNDNELINTTNLTNSGGTANFIMWGGWIAYTPTLGALSGSLGTGNSASGYYKQLQNKTIAVQILVAIGASGIGTADGVTASIPFTAADIGSSGQFAIAGHDSATGLMLQGIIANNDTKVIIKTYDNNNLANNAIAEMTGVYGSQ